MRPPRTASSPAVPLAPIAFGWLAIGLLSYTRHAVHGAEPLLGLAAAASALAWLACYVPWIALTPLVARLERRFPLGGRLWWRNLLVLAAAGLPFALAAATTTLALCVVTRATIGRPDVLPQPIWAAPELLGHTFLYWAAVGGCWVLRLITEARDAEREASRLLLETSRLEASLRQAELEVLRRRLDPHFLFNSLQNISVLTEHDPTTSARMLTRLGDLLRVSLRRDAGRETTLESEIGLTRAYLAIEQMRFGDRLTARVELEPGSEQALVPSLLLQPIVENAIRHGLEPVGLPGVIVIRSRLAGDTLVLTVTDNGAGPPLEGAAPRLGIGLGATRERLALMYPDRHSFEMRAAATGGTEVRLTLPFVMAPIAEEGAGVRVARADRRR